MGQFHGSVPDSVRQVIRETLWHEIAHYFGFSEEEMDRIEDFWADRSFPESR